MIGIPDNLIEEAGVYCAVATISELQWNLIIKLILGSIVISV